MSALVSSAKDVGHAAIHSVCTRLLSNRTFTFSGSRYHYFYHRYNNTCETERAIEIPIARAFLESCHSTNILEIGNVLNHYQHFPHTVVDKYEAGAGVLNIDVRDFAPEQKYDAIISISTMEHVGWDEEPFDPGKALYCIERLRGMLNPEARMLVSLPIGHNSALDQAIANNTAGCEQLLGMKRHSLNKWTEIPASELMKYRVQPAYKQNYGKYRQTRAVAFAYFGPPR